MKPRWLFVAGTAVFVVGSLALLMRAGAEPVVQEKAVSVADSSTAVRVTTIRPIKDANFAVSINQLSAVRAYFQADLKTRVAGVVRCVRTDIGSAVKKGDLLVEIDVPDLTEEVLQKSSTVEQRKQERRVAEAKVKSAEAMVEVARTSIAQQKAGITQASASRDYRKKRFDRYRELLKRQAINEDMVDEQEKEWQSGEGALESAKASLEKAYADVKEKEASLLTAEADVALKKSQIEVAEHELERSRALAGYAKIVAPFDGVVTKRNVDPGDFVQSNTEPLLSLARIDIVSVVAKIPDNAASLITKDTTVEIRIDQLPGTSIKAKVTRFSPSIDIGDRTMRVEVDLLNAAEYSKDDLRDGTEASLRDNKANLGERRLLPGMNGYMRVMLSTLTGEYLVPSSAVFSRGGKQYVMLAENGVAKLIPAIVQVNDGTRAKIVLIRRNTEGQEVRVELNGREEIVESRQAELENGQAIQTNPRE